MMTFSLYFVIITLINILPQSCGKIDTQNVSTTLDNLLAINRYDKRIRPGFGGPPVKISVNLLVKSMGPVSEDDQSFGLDCYFRQHWYDMRLKYYLPGLDEFSFSWLFLEKVWKPDTYFVNGKKSYLHKITSPNKFLRVRQDGFMTYSMRLTITARCPMYLRKFPLDAQKCPLIIGSYGYASNDVLYDWADDDPVKRVPGVELAQFDLVNITIDQEKLQERGGIQYSTVQAHFWLKRHTGYFMLQVYVPCALIVLCSWISFWIDPDAVPARVTLGVTTVLSLTTMGFGSRGQLPKVSYWTALDWFVIICFTSVFSVMVEYACVNFLDKVTKDLKKAIEKKRKDIEDGKEKLKFEEATSIVPATVRQRSASMSAVPSPTENVIRKGSLDEDAPPEGNKRGYLLDLGYSLKVPNIKQHARKLSTTIQEWIGLPGLHDKFTRSVQNLSRFDRGFGDPDMKVPKVVITDGDQDDPQDITLDITVDDIIDEEDEYEEEAEVHRDPGVLQRLKTIHALWLEWRLLPQESDVLKLMADPEPPEKFSNIDIQARRNFPLAFFTSLTIYTVAFAYYLTDDFPYRDTSVLLYRN